MRLSNSQSGNRVAWLALAGVVAAILVVFVFDPVTAWFFPPCILHRLTGLYCPGCGTTRAMHALLHGHLGAAVGYNVLAVLALPVLALFVVRPRWALRPWVAWTGFTIALLFGILRNLPLETLSVLRP